MPAARSTPRPGRPRPARAPAPPPASASRSCRRTRPRCARLRGGARRTRASGVRARRAAAPHCLPGQLGARLLGQGRRACSRRRLLQTEHQEHHMHSTRASDFWCDTLIRAAGTPRRARAQVRTVEGVCAVVGPRLRHRASRDGVHPHRQAAVSCQPQHLPPPCQPVVQRTHQSGDCATSCLQPASVHANAIAAVLRSHKLQSSGATVCRAAGRAPSPAAAAGPHGRHETPGARTARPGSADESAHWPTRPGPIQANTTYRPS